jgi:predicted metal-dependent hydrolase
MAKIEVLKGRFAILETERICHLLDDDEETMPLDWSSDALAEGLRCYQNEEFFLAHEHWESIWLKCEEPEKTFLQALIQTTAAFHHLGRKNFAGAASLLRGALRRLDPFPDAYGGIAVAQLRESIRAWLGALDQEAPPDLPFPQIR